MALIRKNSMALFLAAALVIAMFLPSCHAVAEECNEILPCTETTCEVYCQQLGYEDPKTRCKDGKKGQFFDTCCCRAKNMDAARRLLSE